MWVKIQGSYINFNTIHQFYRRGNTIYLVGTNGNIIPIHFDNNDDASEKIDRIKTVLAIQDL